MGKTPVVNPPRAALFLAVALLALRSAVLAAPPIYTAEWLELHGPEMAGKAHTIQVACVDFLRREGGIAWFNALTSDGKTGTGWIQIGVRIDQIDVVQARYGAWSDFKKSSGYSQRGFSGIMVYRADTQRVQVVETEIIAEAQAAQRAEAIDRVRVWTSADGRTIQAEMLSATRTDVTIRRMPDGTEFTIALDKLSPADRAYVLSFIDRR